MRGLVAILLAGCSYKLPAGVQPGDSDPGSDGAVTGDGNDGSTRSCMDRWFAGDVMLSNPEIVPNLSFGTSERDPWFNKDETFAYFSRPGMGGDTDIMFSERTASGFFNSPVRKDSLSDNQSNDEKVAMTDDELTAVFASTRGIGNFNLFEAKRATAGSTSFETASGVNLAAINTIGNELDPHVSGDGLRLYYAAENPQKIFVAERPTLTAAFAAGVEIANIGDPSGDADPTLSGDERVLVFTSNRTGLGGTDLWYATRPTRNDPFAAPVAVPTVNDGNNDGDAHLSPDGCHLYLVSNRAGSADIYLSVVQ